MLFVFEVTVKAGHTADAYAEAWVAASKIIQRAPGARGTRLHRMIGDPRRLIAIASWDSKADRDAAEAERDPRVQAIFDEQSRSVEIRVIGAFEDPDWTVLPEPTGGSRPSA
jgi:heme-degrading monooxygenase HmoA